MKKLILLDVCLYLVILSCVVLNIDTSVFPNKTDHPFLLFMFTTIALFFLLYIFIIALRGTEINRTQEIKGVSFLILIEIVWYMISPLRGADKLFATAITTGLLIIAHWVSFGHESEILFAEDVDNPKIRKRGDALQHMKEV